MVLQPAFEDMINAPIEPLDIELALCQDEQHIRHPLIYSLFHVPQLNGLLNRSLAIKKQAVKDALAAQDWDKYIWLHEKPYRMWAFSKIHKRIQPDSQYWELLGNIIIDTENLWQEKRRLTKFIHSHRAHKECLMNESERNIMYQMPEELKVWRGCQPHNSKGISWTLDRDLAAWFSKRFYQAHPIVLAGTVNKYAVHAYLNGRSEHEILVDFSDVKLSSKTIFYV